MTQGFCTCAWCGQTALGANRQDDGLFRCDACAEPGPPTTARDPEADDDRLFDFPTTMRGQTALDT